MKSIKKKLINGFAGVFLLSAAGCDLQEANVNPNAVTEVGVNVLLPATQANMTWAVGDFTSQASGILLQYMTGTLNVQQNVTFYAYVPPNFNTPWNHFYVGSLVDLKNIIDLSTENQAFHYRGVAKIQSALLLGYLVDLWGDVPYTQALDIDQFPQPVYDRGEAIYQEVFRLLDEGIADLQSESSTSPAANDLVYPAGNEGAWRSTSLPKWIKAANSLKARYHNHLSKVDPQGSATAALAAINAGGFESNADDLNTVFGNSPDAAGPWFGFLLGSFGQNNIAVAQRFIDMLEDRVAPGVNDPRLPYFIAPNAAGNFVGAEYGAASIPSNVSRVGPYLNREDAPTSIMTYSELKFIEAEAHQRLGQYELAAQAFNDAVEASLLRVTGSVDQAYMAEYGSETGATMADNGLERIFNEKHIDMFLKTESWVDWRRSIPAGAAPTASGIPFLSPADDNFTDNRFPRRFLYPTSELDNNSANIPTGSLLERVFWDL
jgi:hypothetical protein